MTPRKMTASRSLRDAERLLESAAGTQSAGPRRAECDSAGVDAAVGDYIFLFAADEVGPVLAIEDMLALMQEGCDMVSCSRYAHGGRRLGGSAIGGVLSRLANRLFHGLAGCVFSDATTGIKLFRRSLFYTLNWKRGPLAGR